MNNFEILPTPTFSRVIDAAREMNWLHRKDLQARFPDIRMGLSAFMYAHQYKTVRVELGRQTGKTTYIANEAKEGDVIVVRTKESALIRGELSTKATLISSFGQLVNVPAATLKYGGTVWIDDANYTTREVRNSIYAIFADNAGQFVLLG